MSEVHLYHIPLIKPSNLQRKGALQASPDKEQENKLPYTSGIATLQVMGIDFEM